MRNCQFYTSGCRENKDMVILFLLLYSSKATEDVASEIEQISIEIKRPFI